MNLCPKKEETRPVKEYDNTVMPFVPKSIFAMLSVDTVVHKISRELETHPKFIRI